MVVSCMQAKDKEASLANHFDVIAGTSTGGMVSALLTTPHPNDPTRPLFTPAEVIDFCNKYGPSIFNQTRYNQFIYLIINFIYRIKNV